MGEIDKNYQSFIIACQNGELDKVKDYLKKNNYINGKNKNKPPLYESLSHNYETLTNNNLELEKYLIDSGADPNIVFSFGDQGKTPLITSLIISTAEFALDTHHNGFTEEESLDYLEKFLEIIKFLVQYGANINKSNEFGYTPLDLSVKWEHIYAIKFLKNLGAQHSQRFINEGWQNLSLSNEFLQTEFVNKSLTAIFREIDKYKNKNYKPTIDVDYFNKLVFYDDINELDWKERTPLDFAIELGHESAENFLRENGGVLSKNMPLIHKEVRLTLRDSISRKTKEPELGNLPKLIKENDINEIDTQNLTPLDLTIKVKHKRAEEFLSNYKAKTIKELEEENK